ncbi:MAG: protein kinase [Sandaracinaceae bacterium]|nr:protein kinase [Sandaracinaceae bacterium]
MSFQRFGPYELVERLGTGGMAETFLAVRRGVGGFEQHVCVKRILPIYERDPAFVKDFLEEARLAAQLRHPNIAQVVDFGEVEGSHYLALELVDGLDLRTLLARLAERGQRLDTSLVVLIGVALATALDFSHTPTRSRAAVVHRDLSPSNVLVSRSGGVYLTDFGIARAIGDPRRTETGVVRGKVPYMAPEYALHRRFDARTDLFSLGVVLFEALAGRRPFDGATDLDTLARIEVGRHAPLLELAPATPPGLAFLVEALIRADPASRYQSAAQLLEALAPFAPPATAGRELGRVASSLGESLSSSLSLALSSPSRTASLTDTPAPAYPSVSAAGPDAATRTSDAGRAPARAAEPGWSVTNPDAISHHDRPSPYASASGHDAPSPYAAPLASPPALAAHGAQPTAAGAPAWPASPLPSAAAVEPSYGGALGLGATLALEAPAAYSATTPAAAPAIPVTQPTLPVGSTPFAAGAPPRRSRAGLIALLVVLGIITFVVATAGTYAVVAALQAGGG